MKKFALLAATLFALTTASVAQGVRDFTVTDIDGKSYQLYALLDAGKFVLVEVYASW
jgi:cytochrome oxidase Cu insertion factor (SCO1/SenC/PrrC family)